MRTKLILLVFAFFLSTIEVKAFFVAKFISFALKPITIPLNFLRKKTFQAIATTTHTGIKAGKMSLSNISTQIGPVKVRPFDFKRI